VYDPWGQDYRPGFSDDMKDTHGLGPVYFFYVHGDSRLLQRGFIREIDPPYRRGKGLQGRLFGKVWGVGLCRRMRYDNEYVAIREALEAKDIDEAPIEIGDWRGDFEERQQAKDAGETGIGSEDPDLEADDSGLVRLDRPDD